MDLYRIHLVNLKIVGKQRQRQTSCRYAAVFSHSPLSAVISAIWYAAGGSELRVQGSGFEFRVSGSGLRRRVSPKKKIDARLPGKGHSKSQGARPVHMIITMIKWTRTSKLSTNKSLSVFACFKTNRGEGGEGEGTRDAFSIQV